MQIAELKTVSRPVDQGNSLVRLTTPKLRPENRVFVQKRFSPVIALKRSCVTSCVALHETYAKLQRYGNAV